LGSSFILSLPDRIRSWMRLPSYVLNNQNCALEKKRYGIAGSYYNQYVSGKNKIIEVLNQDEFFTASDWGS
jgi:hypothetical protein